LEWPEHARLVLDTSGRVVHPGRSDCESSHLLRSYQPVQYPRDADIADRRTGADRAGDEDIVNILAARLILRSFVCRSSAALPAQLCLIKTGLMPRPRGLLHSYPFCRSASRWYTAQKYHPDCQLS